MTLDQAARIVAEWMGWEEDVDGPSGAPIWHNGGRVWWLVDLLSGDGMLEIKRAAAERGYVVSSSMSFENDKYMAVARAYHFHLRGAVVIWADTEPEAVLLAVVEAIEATRDDLIEVKGEGSGETA